jgi:serine/threonine-protein kinase
VDYGEVGSPVGMIIWLIEEYVEGVCLRDRLAAGGALPSNEVMHVGLGILDSLVAAEEARVVHRDVKPDNILVRSDGAVFLLDFGIARHLDLMSVTPSSAASGPCSPGYSPPEQFKNLKHDIDSRADIFALGVTLYECAMGSNPYLADTTDVREVLRRVEASPLPPLRTDTGISVDLRDLIWAMTRLRRNHRPRSARECQSWLKQIRAVS